MSNFHKFGVLFLRCSTTVESLKMAPIYQTKQPEVIKMINAIEQNAKPKKHICAKFERYENF